MDASRNIESERGAHLPDDAEELSTKRLSPDEYRERIAIDRQRAGRLSQHFDAQHRRYVLASIVLSAASSIFGTVAVVWDLPVLAVVPGVAGAVVVALNTWSGARKVLVKSVAYAATERALQRELVSYEGRADPYGVDLTQDDERADQIRYATFVRRTQDIFDTLRASISES